MTTRPCAQIAIEISFDLNVETIKDGEAKLEVLRRFIIELGDQEPVPQFNMVKTRRDSEA